MEQKQYTPYRSHMPLMNPLYGTPERIVQYSKVAGYFPEKMVAEFDKLTLRQKKVFCHDQNNCGNNKFISKEIFNYFIKLLQ